MDERGESCWQHVDLHMDSVRMKCIVRVWLRDLFCRTFILFCDHIEILNRLSIKCNLLRHLLYWRRDVYALQCC